MGSVLYSQTTIDDVRDELDQIQNKIVNQPEQKQLEDQDLDEDYEPAKDSSIDLNQEIEDAKLAEKIGQYMDALKQIKDDDAEDGDYNPDKDDFNYAKDAEDDASFNEHIDKDKRKANQQPLRRSKRRRRQSTPIGNYHSKYYM